MVGCSKAQGVVLYKGPNILRGNLDDGQIAITPGDLYFAGSPPDERIFHSLAELRIFFAKEVFRQMLPVDPPTGELNEADMILRRELKLNYLAGVVSLTLDKDPSILDRVALDIELYGKPPTLSSGTQSVPDLSQLQNIFGAVKQNYKSLGFGFNNGGVKRHLIRGFADKVDVVRQVHGSPRLRTEAHCT